MGKTEKDVRAAIHNIFADICVHIDKPRTRISSVGPLQFVLAVDLTNEDDEQEQEGHT